MKKLTLLFIALLFLTSCTSKPSQNENPIFPSYGVLAETAEDFQFVPGTKTFIMMFTTHCPYCDEQLNVLEQLAEEDYDVDILLINLTGMEVSEDDVYEYIEKRDISLKTILDIDYHYQNQFRVMGTPFNVIIDKDGHIEAYTTGFLGETTLTEIFTE